jgi:outer membrane protein OmpA-like peptidoglycan-associated protein
MWILRKQSVVCAVSVLAMSVFFSGCATRGYARKQARDVDDKVTALAATVQENSERLDATDSRARQGIADAAAARSAANSAQATANQAAAAAGVSQSAAAAAQANADAANQRAAAADARLSTFQGNIDRYDAGPVTTVMFKVGRADLTQDAMRVLDQVVAPIAGQETGYLVEIAGFTSAEGLETKNVNLSQERSAAVQRYLVSKGASLTRVSTVGLGSDRPIGDNKTKSGREQNRRAEIRVYSAAAK